MNSLCMLRVTGMDFYTKLSLHWQSFTAKKDRESIFDFISDFAVVACDLQLILTLGNHAMILQLIKNHVMILQ